MKKTIYLAGPMRGQPAYNFPAFFKAATELRELGHKVINPAENDMARGFNPYIDIDQQDEAFEAADPGETFKYDFQSVMKSEAVVFLPGWQDSTGARAERLVAQFCRIPCFDYKQGPDGTTHIAPQFSSDEVKTHVDITSADVV